MRVLIYKNGVDVVLKKGKGANSETVDVQYIHFQIALLNFLYKNLPERRNEFPKFYGLLRDAHGRVGIIMDKFAGNYANNYEWNDPEVSRFQQELENIGLPKMNEDYIYPSLFHTQEGIRIGDLLMLARQSIISMNPNIQQEKLHTVAKLLKRYPQLYTIERVDL